MRRISTRLAVSFVLVALLPTVPLSLVVRNLLERRFGPAITVPVEQALDAGLAESRAHLQELRGRLIDRAGEMETGEDPGNPVLLDLSGAVQPADSLRVYLAARPLLGQVLHQNSAAADDTSRLQRVDDTLVLWVFLPVDQTRTWLQPLPAGMVGRAESLTDGVSLMRALRQQQDRVVLSFVGPFLVVYGVLILVALAAAYFWSRQITGPLGSLVAATRRVGAGDLEFRLPHQGTGEVGELVASFDNMVGRLADQRRDLGRLERAAAWRGMARTLAHEVKNPLTPILLAVNQARDQYQGDDPGYRALLEEVAEIVGEEVESLRGLVREFGDFARLPKPRLQPGNLLDLLEDLQQLYGADCLVIPEPAACQQGWFDPESLRRALVNLVDNGLTACRQAGRPEQVVITGEPAEPGILLRVSDRGVGIADEVKPRIFEPDFTTKSDGMGLGLAIVESIVVGHGGRIGVADGPEQGTTFNLELPLTRPVEAAQDGP